MVTSVNVTSVGSGYTSAPTVTIDPPPCTINGTTCIRATATMNVTDPPVERRQPRPSCRRHRPIACVRSGPKSWWQTARRERPDVEQPAPGHLPDRVGHRALDPGRDGPVRRAGGHGHRQSRHGLRPGLSTRTFRCCSAKSTPTQNARGRPRPSRQPASTIRWSGTASPASAATRPCTPAIRRRSTTTRATT